MIPLLFLVSLAALHYVARPPEPAQDPFGLPPRRAAPRESRPAAVDAIATPGLIALGEALEQRGRGPAPQPALDLEEVRKTS